MTKLEGHSLPASADDVRYGREQQAQALLARLAKGEAAALDEFYQLFYRPLFAYLVGLTDNPTQAEDLLQEVMLAVWQSAGSFRAASRVSSWVFGIAHNQAFKSRRQSEKIWLAQLDEVSDLPGSDDAPEGDVLRQATNDEINSALSGLSSAHREVLTLVFYQNFSLKEVAVITGVPEGTVKSRLSYARQALKAALLARGWEV